MYFLYILYPNKAPPDNQRILMRRQENYVYGKRKVSVLPPLRGAE